MDAHHSFKCDAILSQVTTYQGESNFENINTIVSFQINSSFTNTIFSPIFRLCGSEQLCHIKMEFNENAATFHLINTFEENMYQVRPLITSIVITKNEVSEELTLVKPYTWWSSSTRDTYFNSVGYFEIQFTIFYLTKLSHDMVLLPRKSSLYERLLNMYTERKHTDVELIVQNKKYSVHKSIIARSPVFEAMFQHEMREKYQNVVNINGMDANIFEVILKYLYIGEIDITEIDKFENTEPAQWKLRNLLKAADMYQIEDMKNVLGNKIKQFINVNNVSYYLFLASEYNTYNLKEHCMSFIKTYGKKICDNASFKDMLRVNPTIALQLIKYLMDK